MIYPLLERQLKKAGIVDSSRAPEPAAWQELLERISRVYEQNEQDRYLLERSLSLASEEMREEIAERKRAQTALSEERNLLRTVIDTMPDEIYVKDTDSRFILGNVALTHLVGLDAPEQLIGKTDFDFFPRELAAQYLADNQMILRTGQPLSSREELTVDKSGQRAWVLTTKIPLRNQDGDYVGLVGVTRDITPLKQAQEALRTANDELELRIQDRVAELKRTNAALQAEMSEREHAEEALKRERNLLRTLIDTVPAIVYIKDTESRFVDANTETALKMGAETPNDLIGKTDQDFFTAELAAKYLADERAVVRTGQSMLNIEEPSYNERTRQNVWLLTTKVPIRNEQGEVTGLVGVGLDISERKRIEKTLEAERALLRTLIDSLPDYIFAKDRDGRFILSNVAHARAANVANPDEFVGKRAVDFFPKDLASQYDADDGDVVRQGVGLYDLERVTLDASGNQIIVSTNKVPLRDSAGSVVGVIGISRDITAYKRAQEALKRQQDFLRQIIDVNPNLIFVKDWDGKFILVNKAHAELVGTTVEAMIGKCDADFNMPQEEVDRFVQDDREVMTTLRAKHIPEETFTNLTTGQSVWLRTIKVPLLAPDGETRWVLGVANDITERKRAEDALQASEERYRAVTELISDFAFSIRVEPDGTLLDEWITAESFTRCTGYLAEERGGGLGLFHPDDQEAVQQRLDELLRGQASTHESRIITKSGEIRWLRFRRRPIWDAKENRVVRYYAAAEDITSWKNAEEAQRESERLRGVLEKEKELGDLKTRLMVTISHEFRTPLSIAFASTELLDKYYARMTVPQREEHLHRIQGQVGKLTEMLDDISLLIHARFERLALNLEPVDLRKMCEAAILQMQESDKTPQRIVFDADGQLPRLMLDVRRIRYVLTNLLSNALKYSDEASKVSLNLSRRDHGVIIQVTDQGIGIPLAEQARIFEPFYRANNVGVIGGTGLGLSIVKEIVELHKGTIRLTSVVDQGTQITVFLPAE